MLGYVRLKGFRVFVFLREWLIVLSLLGSIKGSRERAERGCARLARLFLVSCL